MKPSEFRTIKLAKGLLIGLIGDYNAPSTWSDGKIMKATIDKYVVVQRHHIWDDENKWDAAMIVNLASPIIFIGIDDKVCRSQQLLLLHRYSDNAWDNSDPIVHVFALPLDVSINDGAKKEDWHPKVVWLSAAATMMIQEEGQLSEFAIALHEKGIPFYGE